MSSFGSAEMKQSIHLFDITNKGLQEIWSYTIINTKNNYWNNSNEPNILRLEDELWNNIGMRVFVNNKRNNSGTISLEYKAIDQLDRLVEVIKKNY